MGQPLTIQQINNRRPGKSRLTAIEFGEPILSGSKLEKTVICRCECGEIKQVRIRSLNITFSCGCYKLELFLAMPRKKQGKYPRKLRQCYHGMMERCYSTSAVAYRYYGERGVIVCEEWRNNIDAFLEWAVNNGWEEGLNLDKDIIPNKAGLIGLIYSPQMCCFVTPTDNQNTRRDVKKYEYNGDLLSISQIARKENIKYKSLHQRLDRGHSLINSINALRNAKSKKTKDGDIRA